MEEKLGSSIPNVFYDLIVFASSTALFLVGILLGVGLFEGDWYEGLGAANILLIFAALLFLSYEYGRIAEAWSAVIVQSPLAFLSKYLPFLGSPDFLAELDNVEESLKLESLPASRKGGKWVVYYYAMLVCPKLGTDLLKRYAWEKLSRNSAFTFCILMIISFVCRILLWCKVELSFGEKWTFGTWEYSIPVLLMACITYYEYYRRNCWNNDLLRKVLTVLYKAEQLKNNKE